MRHDHLSIDDRSIQFRKAYLFQTKYKNDGFGWCCLRFDEHIAKQLTTVAQKKKGQTKRKHGRLRLKCTQMTAIRAECGCTDTNSSQRKADDTKRKRRKKMHNIQKVSAKEWRTTKSGKGDHKRIGVSRNKALNKQTIKVSVNRTTDSDYGLPKRRKEKIDGWEAKQNSEIEKSHHAKKRYPEETNLKCVTRYSVRNAPKKIKTHNQVVREEIQQNACMSPPSVRKWTTIRKWHISPAFHNQLHVELWNQLNWLGEDWRMNVPINSSDCCLQLSCDHKRETGEPNTPFKASTCKKNNLHGKVFWKKANFFTQNFLLTGKWNGKSWTPSKCIETRLQNVQCISIFGIQNKQSKTFKVSTLCISDS